MEKINNSDLFKNKLDNLSDDIKEKILKINDKLPKNDKAIFQKIILETIKKNILNSDFSIYLDNILEKLDLLDKYKLSLFFKNEYENIIKQEYKKELDTLKIDIIKWNYENTKWKLIKWFLDKIPPNKRIKTTIILDKKWSFHNIGINMINFLNVWIKDQVFIINELDNQIIYIKNNIWKYKFQNFNELKIINYKNSKAIYFEKWNCIFFIYPKNWELKYLRIKKSMLNTYKNDSSIFKKIKIYLIWIDKLKVIKYIEKKYPQIKNNFIEKKKVKKQEQKSKKIEKKQEIQKKEVKKNYKNLTDQEKVNEDYKLATENNKYLEKFNTKERLKIIEKYINSEEFKKYIDLVIKNIEWKSVILKIDWTNKTKTITFSKEFIQKNKDLIVKNLKSLLIMIIHIESDGNPLAKTWKSSAEGLWQWLTYDWKIWTEYLYKKKYYTYEQIKDKKININNLYKRKVWHTSSWETTLNKIYLSYKIKLNKYIKWFPIEIISKKYDISPLKINWKEQAKILLLSSYSKNDNKNKILLASLLWNQWWLTRFYKLYHTDPKKKTLNRIREISPKYIKRLKVYKLR